MSELRFTPTAAGNLSLSAAVHRTPGSHAYLWVLSFYGRQVSYQSV